MTDPPAPDTQPGESSAEPELVGAERSEDHLRQILGERELSTEGDFDVLLQRVLDDNVRSYVYGCREHGVAVHPDVQQNYQELLERQGWTD